MYLLTALLSALLLGIWSFGIGQWRGKVAVFSVILVSASSAAVVYVVIGLLSHDLVFDPRDASRGVLGGIVNVTGTVLVLLAFERGKMGVVAGVASASVLVPLAFSFIGGEQVSPVQAIGIGVIFIGLLVFYVPSMRSKSDAPASPLPIVFAGLAALAWGLGVVIIDIGSRVSVTGTMVASQLPQMAFTLVMVFIVARSLGGLTQRAVLSIAAAGVALALGQIAFFTAANEGNIGVVAVLGSLTPLVVALLALGVLKEQMSRSERVALVIVLVGTCLVVY
jgi:uncharacterized membrane protein